MLFESFHSFEQNEFWVRHAYNVSFPVHIHRSFEYFLQRQGTSVVTVDGKEYTLCPGEAVLIFPYQYHSYRASQGNRHSSYIFSPDLVSNYYYADTRRIPTDNRLAYMPEETLDTCNLYLRQGLAYSICGQFDKERTYMTLRASHGEDILKSVLLYADEHYTEDCLLRNSSEVVGYDYAYTSKLFKRQLGITFNQYVNLLRIQKSQTLLTTTPLSITEIANRCGFHSLRAYNRKFTEITGSTPSAFRKSGLPKGTTRQSSM